MSTKIHKITKPSAKRIAIRKQWLESAYAQQILNTEVDHLKNGLRQISGPKVLQVGHIIKQSVVDAVDFPQLIVCENSIEDNDEQGAILQADADIVADPSFLPFDQASIPSVLLPHVLEGHHLPHQVLREAHRVLRSEGHLIITGFNPLSLLGLQRYISSSTVYSGHYFTVKRVVDWLQLLGFEVVASSMFQYAPLSKSVNLNKAFDFLNSMGDRWFPMMGGGYMVVAKKRDAGMTMVGRSRFSRRKRSKLRATASAKSSAKNTTSIL